MTRRTKSKGGGGRRRRNTPRGSGWQAAEQQRFLDEESEREAPTTQMGQGDEQVDVERDDVEDPRDHDDRRLRPA